MKKLRSLFVRYFLPHKRNKYKPYFLGFEMGAVVALSVVLLFLGAIEQEHLLLTNGAPGAAAVVTSSLVDLANIDRAQDGLPALSEDPQLQEAAQLKADDMAHSGYFAHMSPTGKDPWYWFQQAGYDFSYAGENLAVYFSDSDAVNSAWMNSPEHRANLLSANYTQIGIATADGMYQGVETTFVVEEFGTPAAVAVALPPAQPVQTTPTPEKGEPSVAGASAHQASVKVVAQDAGGIAVKNVEAPASAPAPAAATPPAYGNPIELFFLRFVTSPQNDLTIAYEIIGAIVVLALMLEIGVEVRRQHPHRIALGFSLIALMIILLSIDHALLAGTVVIA